MKSWLKYSLFYLLLVAPRAWAAEAIDLNVIPCIDHELVGRSEHGDRNFIHSLTTAMSGFATNIDRTRIDGSVWPGAADDFLKINPATLAATLKSNGTGFALMDLGRRHVVDGIAFAQRWVYYGGNFFPDSYFFHVLQHQFAETGYDTQRTPYIHFDPEKKSFEFRETGASSLLMSTLGKVRIYRAVNRIEANLTNTAKKLLDGTAVSHLELRTLLHELQSSWKMSTENQTWLARFQDPAEFQRFAASPQLRKELASRLTSLVANISRQTSVGRIIPPFRYVFGSPSSDAMRMWGNRAFVKAIRGEENINQTLLSYDVDFRAIPEHLVNQIYVGIQSPVMPATPDDPMRPFIEVGFGSDEARTFLAQHLSNTVALPP